MYLYEVVAKQLITRAYFNWQDSTFWESIVGLQITDRISATLKKNLITSQVVEGTSFFDNEEYSLTVGSCITTFVW